MPTFDEEIRRLMADETASLRAAPDLLERVKRASRDHRRRAWTTAAAASVAAAAVPVAFLGIGSVATGGEQATPFPQATLSAQATLSVTPQPPPIDDTPPPRSDPPNLGDLGDGLEFGHVKVGYLPERLRWSHWSVDAGDSYWTSYNYKGDEKSGYCVQIRVLEQAAVREIDELIQGYRAEGDGEQVSIGDRAGYLVVRHVGEDGMNGTPTLFLKMGDRQWAEIAFSPGYAEEFPGSEAVSTELKKIARGLTSTL